MQDIYGLEATTVIVRIAPDDVNVFNQYNKISIDRIKKELDGKEIECYFQKIAPEEHRITILILGGQFEVYTNLHSSETYQAIVNKKLKTVFRDIISRPLKSL